MKIIEVQATAFNVLWKFIFSVEENSFINMWLDKWNTSALLIEALDESLEFQFLLSTKSSLI